MNGLSIAAKTNGEMKSPAGIIVIRERSIAANRQQQFQASQHNREGRREDLNRR
jgi:hypothetical protein